MNEVRNPEIENQLRALGRTIKGTLPDGWGFTLTLFEYGDEGALFYVSSADRDGVILMLQELMQKLKQG